jgi:hypothetical protein
MRSGPSVSRAASAMRARAASRARGRKTIDKAKRPSASGDTLQPCLHQRVDFWPEALNDRHTFPRKLREIVSRGRPENADPPCGRDRDSAAIEREGQYG